MDKSEILKDTFYYSIDVSFIQDKFGEVKEGINLRYGHTLLNDSDIMMIEELLKNAVEMCPLVGSINMQSKSNSSFVETGIVIPITEIYYKKIKHFYYDKIDTSMETSQMYYIANLDVPYNKNCTFSMCPICLFNTIDDHYYIYGKRDEYIGI